MKMWEEVVSQASNIHFEKDWPVNHVLHVELQIEIMPFEFIL